MKEAILRGARAAGLFELAARGTASRLRILCYHGISQADEHEKAPGTFMRAQTFKGRMALLKDWNVLPLGEGIRRLREGTLPARAVVITIDDGFYSSYAHMVPVLEDLGFPATVYVSTYYVVNQRPLKNLVAAYGADPSECARHRRLMFMTMEEVADLESRGFDIQLHTHRHRYPVDDRECADREILDNRGVLGPKTHFCYPSGVHASWQAEWLSSQGIESATTTDFGLATASDSVYALPRICDSEAMSEIDFEAALCGFKDLFLKARQRSRTTL